MATNITQTGTIITFPMPYDRISGEGVLVGAAFGVCLTSALSGANCAVETQCVATLPKLAGAIWAVGARLFWDDTLRQCDTTNTSDFCIGVAAAAAASGDVTGSVFVTGGRPIPSGT
ncbi:DUF2190 family protein [Sandarakinorhabdus sp.]|uniref:DUF2190 family protein n=1 Tax=Sandarakinorhabdus sp. TaxID=1916663 RepID=UPI0035691C90